MPTKVKAMHSFLGAYKVLSRVIPGCSSLLAPREEAKGGKDIISWSDDLVRAFQRAQQALQDTKPIHIPHPKDTLWIVTDGALLIRFKRGQQTTTFRIFQRKTVKVPSVLVAL